MTEGDDAMFLTCQRRNFHQKITLHCAPFPILSYLSFHLCTIHVRHKNRPDEVYFITPKNNMLDNFSLLTAVFLW